MSKNVLGIDIGTSSVKVMLRLSDKKVIKTKDVYSEKNLQGWTNALKKAIEKLEFKDIDAISFSSQVGTYIINNETVISWDSDIGREELWRIKKKYKSEQFIKEISMPHPDIISYPIPRLIYIKEHFPSIKRICMPKDYFIELFTGEYVSDVYSWRGLSKIETARYSDFFLDELGIERKVLPELMPPTGIAGYITKECADEFNVPENIPVYVGMNDFFSSILGMETENELFDITGTSEHIGVLTDELKRDTKMVSGPYFDKFVHYGVTASSGVSLDFALRELDIDDVSVEKALSNNAPVFTPYLNGERAPVFDSSARGVFFGIGSKCSKSDMAYSVLEGVVFSLYHIYEELGSPEISGIRTCGGASKNKIINELKAELFNVDVYVLAEDDTSALGAVKNALGYSEKMNTVASVIKPCGKYRDVLLKRFNIYKRIYASLKSEFKDFTELERK